MKHRYTEMMESAKEYVAEFRPKLENAHAVADFMRPLIQNLTQEILYVISLDTRNLVLSVDEVTRGLVDRCQSHPREVFRPAIIAYAKKVIMCHNHPSGDPMPSVADIVMSKSIQQAGEVLGIELSDHVVLSGDSYTSMREAGVLLCGNTMKRALA